jgi:hypothetical protein
MNINDLPCLKETVEKLGNFPWNDLQLLVTPMALELLDVRLLLVPSKGKYKGNVVVRISPEVNKFDANSLVALAAVYTLAKDNSDFTILKGIDKVTNEPLLYLNKKNNNE